MQWMNPSLARVAFLSSVGCSSHSSTHQGSVSCCFKQVIDSVACIIHVSRQCCNVRRELSGELPESEAVEWGRSQFEQLKRSCVMNER